MRKLQLLFVCLLASLMCQAQSAVKIDNRASCLLHVALFAELPGLGYPFMGLRADVQVPPFTTYNFADYDAVVAASTTAPTWSSGVTIPPATFPGFLWNVAQLQFVSCSMGGCGTNVGGGYPGYPPVNSSSCMNATYANGAVPGDIEITVW